VGLTANRRHQSSSTAAIVLVLRTGGAVSLAGPVGFIGLMVPHMVATARWGSTTGA